MGGILDSRVKRILLFRILLISWLEVVKRDDIATLSTLVDLDLTV